MRVPDTIRKCVLYLGVESGEGEASKVAWRGTCFFVSLAIDRQPFSFIYLVTAKHCADQLQDKKAYLRVNSQTGDFLQVQINKGEIKWFFHPTDKAADVAIAPLGASQKIVDYLPLPSGILLTESVRLTKDIGVGDEVFIVGLFVHHVGTSKNIPIIRTGNIAMTPDERIHTNYGDMEAYLIESRSIGGLSGSPVFVFEHTEVGKSIAHLLGLIHGHWDCAPESIFDQTSEDIGIQARLNMGIAIVTPASKILDIINCEELTNIRNKSIAERKSKNSPAPN